jgi:hypothetical protein
MFRRASCEQAGKRTKAMRRFPATAFFASGIFWRSASVSTLGCFGSVPSLRTVPASRKSQENLQIANRLSDHFPSGMSIGILGSSLGLASPLYNQNNTSQFDETRPSFFDKTVCYQILERISQTFLRVNLYRYLPSSAAHFDKPVPPTIDILWAMKRTGRWTLLPLVHDHAFYWHNGFLRFCLRTEERQNNETREKNDKPECQRDGGSHTPASRGFTHVTSPRRTSRSSKAGFRRPRCACYTRSCGHTRVRRRRSRANSSSTRVISAGC